MQLGDAATLYSRQIRNCVAVVALSRRRANFRRLHSMTTMTGAATPSNCICLSPLLFFLQRRGFASVLSLDNNDMLSMKRLKFLITSSALSGLDRFFFFLTIFLLLFADVVVAATERFVKFTVSFSFSRK
jgi:hypothetical protein